MSTIDPERRSILLSAAALGGLAALPLMASAEIAQAETALRGTKSVVPIRTGFASDGTISIEVRDTVALIGLGRTGNGNWVNSGTPVVLPLIYERIERDPSLGAAVLYALGDDFSSGLNDSTGIEADAIEAATWRGKKPFIAVAHGETRGLANGLLLAADVRIASADARFTHLDALAPKNPAAQTLIEDVGRANAKRYLLSGDACGAHEAFRIGLVQDILPTRDEALDAATEMARRMAMRRMPIASS
jgi:enoyl-CoA hydratase